MRRGYVTKWLDHRNFGFVSAEGGEDVFVHGSVLVGAASLAAGDRVEFAMQVQRSAGSKSTKYSATSCWRIDKEPQYDFTFPASDARVSVEHFMHMAGVDWDLDKTFHMMQPFIAFSSVNCPFLVISEAGLLEGVRAPSAFELSTLLQLLVAYAQGCSAARSFILADFEGEMLGYCGELSTAALLETWVVDGYLRPLRVRYSHFPLGLLIDLRSDACIRAFRPLMESPTITKVMWGADADFESLMHQEIPISLKVDPKAVTDVQLAFSNGDRRLGMARMLERLPPNLQAALPDKKQIDWHAHHSQNRRALHLPMSLLEATYAMDDLHRIEAIVATQRPPDGSYAAARQSTEVVLAEVKADPCGWKSLERNRSFYYKSLGIKKLSCAVRLVRHSIALRSREKNGLDLGPNKALALEIEKWAAAELAAAGVVIPSDLSFQDDHVVQPAAVPPEVKPSHPAVAAKAAAKAACNEVNKAAPKEAKAAKANAEAPKGAELATRAKAEAAAAKAEAADKAAAKDAIGLKAQASQVDAPMFLVQMGRQSRGRRVFPWLVLGLAVLLALMWWLGHAGK
ncbi:unnamed protein product [Effrenium voratum]|nr:unnamed protein product [Effrenium voratum]